MEKWLLTTKKADFEKWATDFNISPILARILRNRDLTEETMIKNFLFGSLKDCHSPWLLKDMDKAVKFICNAVMEHKHIRIIGDYDVDGICATYILQKGLKDMGASCDMVIPHRVQDGYGLSDNLIEEAKEDQVDLIITCDNGIAASKQIELANELGMDVIITDHHEVPFIEEEGVVKQILPSALAVIDPKQEDCDYPFKGICGAVVAYKLMVALSEKSQNENLQLINSSQENQISQEELDEFLGFAAWATVCDVMELVDENRIIVKEGIKQLQRTQNNGLRALIEVCNIAPENLSTYHLGYVLGPCLNAAGGLDTAKLSLELLCCPTRREGVMRARELKDLNDSRKNMTLEGVAWAEEYISDHLRNQDKVMVIYLPKLHESLAGIIAGKIRDRYYHPVFVLTKSEEGSGRSIEGYHMYQEMTAVKQYFSKYGGHSMAAGLSMREEDIEDFLSEINENCSLDVEDFIPKVKIDIPMPLSYGTMELAKEITLLEPFGVGNPKPMFAEKDLIFVKAMRMGVKKNFARFWVKSQDGKESQLIYFGDLDKFDEYLMERYGEGSVEQLYAGQGSFLMSVVYQLELNYYNGQTQVQYQMQFYC